MLTSTLALVFARLLLLSLANAAFATTVSRSKISRPLREWCNYHVPWLGALLGCPYCLSHYGAVALVLATGTWGTQLPIMDLVVTVLAVVAVTAIITGAMMRLLLIHEHEIEELRAGLTDLTVAFGQLQQELTEPLAHADVP